MPEAPLVIVGNSLSVLVAATERARQGQRTTVVNPGGPWGGYFGGLQADGRRWDAGMVTYEFTSFRAPGSPPRLSSYDPLLRNDVGRFVDTVRRYVEARQPTRVIEPPQMRVDGHWLPDLLLTNGLAALSRLRCADQARIELRRVVEAARHAPWHARRKNEWSADGRQSDGTLLDIDTVSRANHGRVLHETVFAPFARQVLGRDADDLAALYHRIPWLPLYWPETLLAWLEGRPQPLPPTEFSYPVAGSIADLCAALGAELSASPLIDLRACKLAAVGPKAHGYRLSLENGETMDTRALAWGLSPHQGLLASGSDAPAPPERRLPLLLGLLRLPRARMRREFSVVHVLGPDSGVYRINHMSACAGEHDDADIRLVIEANPEVLAARHGTLSSDEATLRALVADLAGLGVLDPGTQPGFAKFVRMAGALPLPTAEGLASYAAQRSQLLERLSGVATIGPCAGPFATSLSDQIVQGLALTATD